MLILIVLKLHFDGFSACRRLYFWALWKGIHNKIFGQVQQLTPTFLSPTPLVLARFNLLERFDFIIYTPEDGVRILIRSDLHAFHKHRAALNFWLRSHEIYV